MCPLILLPGLACDAALWREQLPALAATRPVRVSDVHTRHMTLPRMAAALLDQNEGELLLCGASMGGMLALEVQRQAPQRVRGMALLGSSARADTAELIQLRSDAIRLFEQGRMDEVLQANVAFAFHPDNAGNAELVQVYLDMIQRAGAAQLIAQNRAVMARIDSRPLLAAVRCPVLAACGAADQLTPPDCSREIAALVPGARFELLPGCGHMLTLEQPQRVSALLLDWLGGLDTVQRV